MLQLRVFRLFLVRASALVVFLVPAVAAANIITVNSAADTIADDSACTLREAIIAANTNTASGETPGECAAGAAGHDMIFFAIPGAGVRTILPSSAFPPVIEPLTIDGYTQPGASLNTYSFGNNAVLAIEINGSNAGNLSGGLLEIAAGNSAVRGLAINRVKGADGAALRLTTVGGNIVAGNWIGIDTNGFTRLANQCSGVAIESSAGNTIGGFSPGDRNVITGLNDCGAGILISGSADNQVINNYIGTNAEGWTIQQSLMTGILIGDSPGGTGSTGNVIGGTTSEARNVISLNGIAVILAGPGTSGNIVQGNYIGLSSSGNFASNKKGGIRIHSSAHDNMIGGIAAGAGNRIQFNREIGVSLDAVPSPAGSGNAILGNLISDNSLLGIDLNADGLTANDACDGDAGPNELQNFPVLTLVTAGAGSTTIQGTLDAAADKQYRLEFFASDNSAGNTLLPLGQNFLGSATVTTDSSCHSDFEVTFPLSVPAVAQVTATATDDHNNTSEFAPFVGVRTQYYTLAPCRVADTRDPPGPSGGPALLAGKVRTFPVAGLCEIPATARAVEIVLAVWDPPTAGDLRVYPAAGRAPQASTINFRAGVVRANPAIIPLSLSGEISVLCDCLGNTNIFFDVYGYYQ